MIYVFQYNLTILPLLVVGLWYFWSVEMIGIILDAFWCYLCDFVVLGGLWEPCSWFQLMPFDACNGLKKLTMPADSNCLLGGNMVGVVLWILNLILPLDLLRCDVGFRGRTSWKQYFFQKSDITIKPGESNLIRQHSSLPFMIYWVNLIAPIGAGAT